MRSIRSATTPKRPTGSESQIYTVPWFPAASRAESLTMGSPVAE